MLKGNPALAANHLVRGAQLLLLPQFRPYILVPLLINIVLFIILTGYLIANFNSAIDAMLDFLPGWDWVKWLVNILLWFIWPLFAALVMMIYGYTFNLMTNIIAAPFYGLLAEKIENHLIDGEIESEPLAQMIPRTILRELLKLWYFISRGFVLALLSLMLIWVPLLNMIVPLLWLLWGAWSMAIQYNDYPADNHKTPFTKLRQWLASEKLTSYSFGGLVMLAGMIPLVNIFAMPIAVAGATVNWVERGKNQCLLIEGEHSA
jgi:CysZ protein